MILQNIERLIQVIQTAQDHKVAICAVTKYATIEQIAEVAKSPHIQICGENKVQDGIKKAALFPELRWEFIGHLQRNKVRKAVEHFDRIQSVDSLKCAQKIDKVCAETRPIEVLIQVNGGEESAKYGFSLAECRENQEALFNLPHLQVRGVMVVAPNTKDSLYLARIFSECRQLFENWKKHSTLVDTLSMGMSHDFRIAIEEGTTMVRLGRIILEGG